MNLVDSSCWVEYFAGSPLDQDLVKIITRKDQLLVPSVVVMEVFKHALSRAGYDAAVETAAAMSECARIVDLDMGLAMLAARTGLEHKLPLADSIIYATARATGATLWTQDAHFEGLPGVRYLPRPSPDGGQPSLSSPP